MLEVVVDDGTVQPWLEEKFGGTIWKPSIVFGILDQGELKGGFYFDQYNGHNIEVHFYGPGCITRHVIRETFSYPFLELKCLRITARTRRGNKPMCRLLPRLGFDYEATLKNFFGPTRQDDAIVYRLTHEFASKWI